MSRQLTTLFACAAVLALSIATPRLCLAQPPPNYSGTVQADFRMDASGGISLAGANVSLTFGSLTLPVSCTGQVGQTLWYTTPFNWSWGNSLPVTYNLVERVFDLGGNLVEYDTRTESVSYFYEDFINTGPTERTVGLPISLSFEHGLVELSPGVLIKYDVTIDGGRQVFLDQNATIESLVIGPASALTYPDDFYSLIVRSRIDNAGTFRKVGNTIVPLGIPFNNTGTVEVQSGTLALSGGGTSPGRFDVASGAILEFAGGHTLQSGSTITGPGLVRVNGNVGLENTGVSGNVQVVAGHLGITGAVNVSGRLELTGSLFDSYVGGPGDLRVTGRLDWLGGTMDGEGGSATIAAGAEMRISGDDHKRLRNQTINNAGTVVWTGAGMLFGSSGVFNNQAGGVFEIQSDSTFLWWDRLAYGWPTFNNAGILRKSEGTGTTTFDSVTFNNTGTVEVQSGTLAFQGGYTQTDGATMLTGGTLRSGSALDIQGGDIGGWGTIISDLLNAGGRTSPGTSIGHLMVAGNYTQGKDAKLLIELAGTAFGDFDVLEVAGYATLDGTLGLTFLDGFRPQLGDTFEILTYGSRSGEFGVIEVLGFPSCLRRVSGRAGLAAAQVTDRPDAVGQAFSHCRATPLPAVIGLTNP